MAKKPARAAETVRLPALETALFCVLEELPELELPEPVDEPAPVEAAPLVTLVMVEVPSTELLAEASVAWLEAADDDDGAEVLWDCETASRPWLIVLAVEHWLLEGAG